MRRYVVIAFCTVLASCTLDESPRDQIPEAEAFTNGKALFQNTIATLYNYIGGYEEGQGLQGTCRGIYDLQTFGSDEAMLPTRGVDWYDGAIWQDMYRHSWTPGHALPKNAWLYLYKVITLCNSSLEQLEAHRDMLDEQLLVAYRSEVRALRAIYYWQLMDLFGRVPLITSTAMSMNEVKQSERNELFSFIEQELLATLSLIPADNSVHEGTCYGRVTFDVVCFVLAKLYLNAEIYTGTPHWEDCIEFCNRLKDRGYRLEEQYTANFAVHNESSDENIWTIPMDKNLYRNQQQNLYRSYHYRHAALYGFCGENGTCATRRVLEVFDYGTDSQDKRFDMNYWAGKVVTDDGVTCFDRMGRELVYEPWAVDMDISGSPYVETAGARMKKYAVDKHAVADGKLMDNDIVLFRYADVLLMRAEARYRLSLAGAATDGSNGQDDYDAVRLRAGMPTRLITLKNLLDERLLELCWEGWRRQDLIRFGQYRSLYDGTGKVDESDGHTTVFPIPADVMALNHNLTQNKGY